MKNSIIPTIVEKVKDEAKSELDWSEIEFQNQAAPQFNPWQHGLSSPSRLSAEFQLSELEKSMEVYGIRRNPASIPDAFGLVADGDGLHIFRQENGTLALRMCGTDPFEALFDAVFRKLDDLKVRTCRDLERIDRKYDNERTRRLAAA